MMRLVKTAAAAFLLGSAAQLAAADSGDSTCPAAEGQLQRDALIALWNKHVNTEFVEKSADAAVATMTDDAYVNHVPTMTGGTGKESARSFYATYFIPQMPADIKIEQLHLHTGIDGEGHQTVIEEFIVEFTHSQQMAWMTLNLPPTGLDVRVAFVGIITFRGDKVLSERLYWDQATVLKQLKLIDLDYVPGAEQADKATDQFAFDSNRLVGLPSSR